jgi:phosphoserine aminotransferase
MFLQGGASLQFAMIPMNLRPAGASADYIVTGTWSKTAAKEASKLGTTRLAANLEPEGFKDLPSKLDLDAKAAYLHFTSNETIHGVEFKEEPEPPAGVPLLCDASSDFISRPVDVSKYALIYAGAQKNAGPAGVVIVIARDDVLEHVPANLPTLLDFKAMAASGSLHNTPPCYAIYIVSLVLKWAKQLGGMAAVAKRNQEKAALVYKTIDESGGFYRGHAAPAARSVMNIPFRLPTEQLEEAFASESKKSGLIGLKGHRSVGGMRASPMQCLDIRARRLHSCASSRRRTAENLQGAVRPTPPSRRGMRTTLQRRAHFRLVIISSWISSSLRTIFSAWLLGNGSSPWMGLMRTANGCVEHKDHAFRSVRTSTSPLDGGQRKWPASIVDQCD